jgi:hypothetical protein
MKYYKYMFIAIAALTLMVSSAQAQSWGFRLGNGASFFYKQNDYRPARVTFEAPRPIYYPVAQYHCPDPVVYEPPRIERIRVLYSRPSFYFPRTPRTTSYYSHCVDYPRYRGFYD